MGINTVDFIIGKYNYVITEDTSRNHVAKVTVEAFAEDGSRFAKEPVVALGKTHLEALIKAYGKLATSTICKSQQQLEFVFKLMEIAANYKDILEELPV